MSLLIFLVLLLLLLLLLLLEVEAAALTSLPLFNAVFITIISLFYDCVRIVTSSTRESLRKREGKKQKKKGWCSLFFFFRNLSIQARDARTRVDDDDDDIRARAHPHALIIDARACKRDVGKKKEQKSFTIHCSTN
jgi:hypothetical protein